MKKAVVILILALVAGLASFYGMRSHQVAKRAPQTLLESMPELAWLRTELKLTDAQFAKVSELHAAYRPECTKMCQRIAEAHERLEWASREKTEISPQLQEAIKDHAQIHADCQTAMLNHLYRTAAQLDKKQADRYLQMMLPYALDFAHSENGGIHPR